jgi:F-type H+-transporting ATPase subunit epsilon
MTVDILTPEKKLFSGEATAVQLPGINGLFQVLNNHASLVSALKQGVVKVDADKDSKSFTITGGFCEVLDNKVTVLVEGIIA